MTNTPVRIRLNTKRLLPILLLVMVSAQVCFAKPRELVTFTNNYRGLRPGKSTLKDVTSVLGRHISVKATSNGHNYRFPKVIVNISGRDKVHINTITVDKDYSYVTGSGIKLGQPVSVAKKHLPKYKEGKGWIYDNQKGFFFWHDGKHITKIVLVYQAYRM